MAEKTLKEKTSKGLFWGGLSNLVQQLLGAFFGIYLARTLSPGDYGLVGMLAIFSFLSMILQESGFPSALINRDSIRHEDYNSVFWFNVSVAVVSYAILFFCAPLIARFFHHPELVKISRIYFISLVIYGLGVSHRAYLSKLLMVKEISIANTLSTFISGSIGIFLAWKGFGYWTLVFQSLIQGVLTNAAYWYFSPWRPTFNFNIRPILEMFPFGSKLLVTSVFSALSNNSISVVLGRYYDSNQVGYYSQANKWNVMGTGVLSGMINGVAQPVLATVVDERERQLRITRKMMRFAAFVSFPAMLGLAFISREFIILALTEKWENSITLLQILCIGGSFAPFCSILSGLVLSRGKASWFMWTSISQTVVVLITIFICHFYGVTGMVIGITSVNVLWPLVWFFLVHKELGYTFVGFISDLAPFFGITLISIAAAWFITRGIENTALLLAAKIITTAVIYVLIMSLSASVTFKECVQFIKDRVHV